MDSPVRDELLKKEYGSLERLKEVFDKWLLLPDTHLLEVILAAIVANQLGGDPLWLLIVAPPSSAKTELIRARVSDPLSLPAARILSASGSPTEQPKTSRTLSRQCSTTASAARTWSRLSTSEPSTTA